MDMIFALAGTYKHFVDGLAMKYLGVNLNTPEGIIVAGVGAIGLHLLGNLFSEIAHKI